MPYKWRVTEKKIINLGMKEKIDVEHRHLPATTTN